MESVSPKLLVGYRIPHRPPQRKRGWTLSSSLTIEQVQCGRRGRECGSGENYFLVCVCVCEYVCVNMCVSICVYCQQECNVSMCVACVICASIINPRRACAARVTVVRSVCVCVCLSVCLLLVISFLKCSFVSQRTPPTERAVKVRNFERFL